MTIDASIAKDFFKAYDRDYFTITALEAILDYYDEIGDDVEFDVIAICCDWNEYGNNCTLNFSNFLNDYSYLMDGDDDFNDLDDDEDEDEKVDVLIEKLIEELEKHTYITRLKNGNILMQVF